MTLAWNLEPQYVHLGDSAELDAYIYDENDVPVPMADLASVVYTIEDPSGTQTVQNGTIVGDGHGYTQYLNTGTLIGKYIVVAQFTFSSGRIKSSTSNFEIIDPFHPP